MSGIISALIGFTLGMLVIILIAILIFRKQIIKVINELRRAK